MARSSSGGIFYLLARCIIREGGVVAGAAFNEQGLVVHRFVSSVEELPLLQGSKYVQSNTTQIFKQCKEALEQDKPVLFSGTPCQVAAVKSCIGESDQLYTVELICHGVPSPGFWEAELTCLMDEGLLSDLSQLSFRRSDAHNRTEFVLSEKGKPVLPLDRDLYYSLFTRGASLREACYQCRYATVDRQGDILIGDCASSQTDYEFHPYEPVSSVFPLTDAGSALLEKVRSFCDFSELDVEREERLNKQLVEPSCRPSIRDTVYRDLTALSRDELKMRYLPAPSIAKSIKELIKRVVPVRTRVFIRRTFTRNL